jgi:hypothetical protein
MSLASELDADQISQIAQLVLTQFQEPDRPELAAARLQVCMELAYKQHRDRVTQETNERLAHTDALLRGKLLSANGTC